MTRPKRRYVVTLEVVTENSAIASLLRKQLKRVAGAVNEAVGVKVSTYTIDGPTRTQPVVMMERILP